MTYDQLIEWAERNPYAEARILTGGRVHTGRIGIESTTTSDGVRRVVRVRDSSRVRNQYSPVFQRHLDAGAFEIKDGARYRPITEEDLRS